MRSLQVLLSLYLFLAVSSCSFQKRNYLPGYHTEHFWKQKHNTNAHTEALAETRSFVYNYSLPAVLDSTPCDTLVFKDAKRILIHLKEQLSEEVKYSDCGTQLPVYAVYSSGLQFLLKSTGDTLYFNTPPPIVKSDSATCDKLYYKNGQEREVIVTKIGEREVDYKLCNDTYGITYAIPLEELYLIKYANGGYDVISKDISDDEKEPKEKEGTHSKLLTFILCLALGAWGAHRFYLRRYGTAILYLLTAGFCGIGVVIDIVRILTNDLTPKNGTYKDDL